MELLIILTTTVYVQNKIFLYQTNPSERLTCYLKSINNWLKFTNFKILVVENSGYTFPDIEQNDRLQIISYNENTLPESQHLIGNTSKGASELFAINYGFHNCKFKETSNFIIKITGRYFIPGFREYLDTLDLDSFDVICQSSSIRCEFLGCKSHHFNQLFDKNCVIHHIEFLYSQRINQFDKIIKCKPLQIEQTQKGGENDCYDYL